jgi:hypothetical protein
MLHRRLFFHSRGQCRKPGRRNVFREQYEALANKPFAKWLVKPYPPNPYYNLSTSCFFCTFFILLFYKSFICNVLTFIFVLEVFRIFFINSVNQCKSVSNFFDCGPRPRRANPWLKFYQFAKFRQAIIYIASGCFCQAID